MTGALQTAVDQVVIRDQRHESNRRENARQVPWENDVRGKPPNGETCEHNQENQHSQMGQLPILPRKLWFGCGKELDALAVMGGN